MPRLANRPPASIYVNSLLAAVMLAALSPSAARANAAEPLTYYTDVEGNEVTICPENFNRGGCDDGEPLLRHNTETGETVVVAENCGLGTHCSDEKCCYVDTCVPKGSYRYGFADPYACNDSSAKTTFYRSATVDTEAENCTPNSTEGHDGELPWEGENRIICRYQSDPKPDRGCKMPGCAPGAVGFVFLLFALVLSVGLSLSDYDSRTDD